LEENGEALEIVRHEELLELWVAANRQTWRDLPVRFIVKQDEKQFFAAVARYAAAAGQASEMFPSRRRAAVVKSRPRCCLGLFTAADVLGYGFVRGVSPLLYLERLDLEALRQLGLSLEDADRRADVLIRVPSNREAIFRAVVLRAGLPVSDLLQVWIDVSAHPSRGREQAHEIWRRVLKPLLGSLS
jgi:hypothetical protein